ncbi:PQQ-binding-like beta-propeller repeat protein [Marivirga sp. S37H4]|uniref:PQQ-binding-like beta-propeller repeat protein n=1 Tax=Marivirga aurantiaca TaxID=2802615 RepID=A0A934WX74_9BACT|nr:PQQ-binding-like beta-propeller repeat protein [Marivirga aurantiaca]MBK6264773.1 PQQ-binding-like beta-propeller repeat protein [Marivirga aurantiaca]
MFKKKYVIEDKVNKGFLVEAGEILLQATSYLKKIDICTGDTIVESKLNSGLNIQKIEKSNDYYIGLASGKIVFFDCHLKLKEEKTIRYVGYHLYDQKYLVKILDYDYTTFKGKYSVFDLLSGNDLWEIDTGEMIKVDSNIAFTASSKEVGKRDFATGESEWTYEIDNENFVPELIGVFKDLVFFGLQKKDKLIALDLATGALKWERKSFPSLNRLDQEKGVIHSISNGYCKLNASTGEEVDTFIDQEYFKGEGVFSQRNNYAIDGDHLITTDYKKGVIGSFNTVTHKFDWLHEEKGVSFPAPSPIIYQAPYLLVHDNKGTLHIFEKE